MLKTLGKIALTTLVALSGLVVSSQACTRVICNSGDRFITARNMDWEENIETALWIFPKGMKRDGGINKDSIKWTSKYGSVVASAFDIATADGMNEKGLVANILWLAESDYGESTKPTLSIGAFAQYVLDNYENVDKAVKGLKQVDFQIVAPTLPDSDEQATVHLAISDPTGDSAIIEFIDGEMIIHHSKNYKVATNSPSYDQQLSINSYWEEVGGDSMLPGTHRPADRFVRASFYTHNTLQSKLYEKENMAVARALSIVKDSSVPLGISTKKEAEFPSTIWSSISDQKALKYYFYPVVSPSIFWVDIKKVDLSQKGEVKKLDLSNYPNYSGEASGMFVKSKPFKWLK